MIAFALVLQLLAAQPEHLTWAPFVRVRAEPAAQSAVVEKLSVGAHLVELPTAHVVNGSGDDETEWVNVKTDAGNVGWFNAGYLESYDPAHPEKAWLAVWKFHELGPATFVECLDVHDQMTRIAAQSWPHEQKGLFEHARLVSLEYTAAKIGKRGKKAPYKAFIDRYRDILVYLDAVDGWFLRPEPIHAAFEMYRDTRVGEPLAWLKAVALAPARVARPHPDQNDLIDYLKLYPNSANTKKALEYLHSRIDYGLDPRQMTATELDGWLLELAGWRVIVQKCADEPERKDVLADIEKLTANAKELRAAKT